MGTHLPRNTNVEGTEGMCLDVYAFISHLGRSIHKYTHERSEQVKRMGSLHSVNQGLSIDLGQADAAGRLILLIHNILEPPFN